MTSGRKARQAGQPRQHKEGPTRTSPLRIWGDKELLWRVSNVPFAFSFACACIDYCVIEGHTLRGAPCLVLTSFLFSPSQHHHPGHQDLPRLDCLAGL